MSKIYREAETLGEWKAKGMLGTRYFPHYTKAGIAAIYRQIMRCEWMPDRSNLRIRLAGETYGFLAGPAATSFRRVVGGRVHVGQLKQEALMYGESKWMHGLHDPGYEDELMGVPIGPPAGYRPGWIVFTHEIGHDPSHMGGFDYRPWADKGYGIIARLNNGYGIQGTIPLPEHYEAFAQRVANWVANSQGCHIWIIGNEPNTPWERPDGEAIWPWKYAECYAECWKKIHERPGLEQDQVVLAPIGPWNNQTTYQTNLTGDWVKYFEHVVGALRVWHELTPDAIALHAYTHGSDPALASSDKKMKPPFERRRYHLRTYRDFLASLLQGEYRDTPVYVTECDQDSAWSDIDTGWMEAVFDEFALWNRSYTPKVRAVCMYCCDRRPNQSQWHLPSRPAQMEAFKRVVETGYAWRDEEPEPPPCDPPSERPRSVFFCPWCGTALHVFEE